LIGHADLLNRLIDYSKRKFQLMVPIKEIHDTPL